MQIKSIRKEIQDEIVYLASERWTATKIANMYKLSLWSVCKILMINGFNHKFEIKIRYKKIIYDFYHTKFLKRNFVYRNNNNIRTRIRFIAARYNYSPNNIYEILNGRFKT